MKFFIGVLSLAVIIALVGTPAVLLFGWGYLTASDRQAISRTIKSASPADSRWDQQSVASPRAGTSG